jgi:4-hydroxybenzoate polyprenyltransferase
MELSSTTFSSVCHTLSVWESGDFVRVAEFRIFLLSNAHQVSHLSASYVKKFFSFVKIEHTLFSLPLIYSGVLLGSKGKGVSWGIIILVLTAATGARTVAFALNRIIDRRIDALNPRTATRDLPSGRMTLWEASWVMLSGMALYFVSAYCISEWCFTLSPLPLAVFVIYPTMKRYTPLAHFGVGLGLAMGPLGGWFAVSPSVDNLLAPALLSLFTLFWVAGFDIIYATLDEEFDRKESLYSFPSRFGKVRALRYSGYLHLVAFGLLVALFFQSVFSLLALPLLLLTGYLLYLEQKKAEDVELAFFKINAVAGFSVFTMILIGVVV